jgi:hypothetical protein
VGRPVCTPFGSACDTISTMSAFGALIVAQLAEPTVAPVLGALGFPQCRRGLREARKSATRGVAPSDEGRTREFSSCIDVRQSVQHSVQHLEETRQQAI